MSTPAEESASSVHVSPLSVVAMESVAHDRCAGTDQRGISPTHEDAGFPGHDSVLLLLFWFAAQWTGEATGVGWPTGHGAGEESGAGHVSMPDGDALNFSTT